MAGWGGMDEEEEQPRAVARKVYTIYEGRETERNYFNHFSAAHDVGTFQIIPIDKDGFDIDQTNRGEMINIIKSEMYFRTKSILTPYKLATVILRQYYDKFDSAKEIKCERYHLIRKKIINEANNKKIISKCDDKIHNVDKFIELSLKIMDRNGLKEPFSFKKNDSVNPPGESFNKDLDKVFIVFDRDIDISDPTNRSDEEYAGYFDTCKKLGYEILLSNPAFEFWLLLHHSGVDYRFYFNVDVQVIEDELEKLENEKYTKIISKEKFDRFYKDTFEFAVNASYNDALSTKLTDLLRYPGTNVGIALKSLLE